jgi:hypothetical protein
MSSRKLRSARSKQAAVRPEPIPRPCVPHSCDSRMRFACGLDGVIGSAWAIFWRDRVAAIRRGRADRHTRYCGGGGNCRADAAAATLACIAIFLSGSRGAVPALGAASVFLAIRSRGDGARKFRHQFFGSRSRCSGRDFGLCRFAGGHGYPESACSVAGRSGRTPTGNWRESL